MTALVHDPDHAARGVARLIERYRRPRTSALLTSWLGEVQSVEDALWQLLVERSIVTAKGAQLDVLGAIVGEPRQGRDDETYRLWISARTMVLRSSGTTTEMLAIARKLVPPEDQVRLEEYYPAALLMRVAGVLPMGDGYQIARMLHLAKPAGVLFGMTWTMADAGATFTFAPLPSTPVPSSPMGFNAGVWAFVADGTYLPPQPDAVATPAGQLTIDGVPLVVGGVPLVISPAVPLRALPEGTRLPVTLGWPAPRPPVLVARSVKIVPRALPASIELEDAFGDSSLEMTAGGDQFRVALALQGALEDALQDERLGFSLRKVSTDVTVAEEIGVLRFDRSRYDSSWTVRLVAEMDVAVAGQTATLQLVSLNDGVLRATLTTSALTTTQCAVVLDALPAADVLYSVRLARSGGLAGNLVSCRAVALEVSHG